MPPKARLFAFALLACAGTAAASACSADGGSGVADEFLDTTPTDPEQGATLPAASNDDDDDVDVDGGTSGTTDASKDSSAKPDSAIADAGKPSPAAGSACSNIDEIFSRKCGACGSQEALCLTADGGGGIVSEYSPCAKEVAGGCVPGTVENTPCGKCGTKVRTCTATCAWTTAACAGEPANACWPTSRDYTSAGCSAVDVVRTRDCNASCAWSSFTSDCSALDFKLVASGTAGGTASAIYPLRATLVDKRISGTCPNGSLTTTTNHPYLYVEIVNPTDKAITASAWNTRAGDTGPIIDTVMTWYASTTKPTDDASRKACTGVVVDACPTGLPCGDYKWAGITGTNTIKIPASGSVILYFASYFALTSTTSVTVGDVGLVVRTDTVAP